MDAADPRAVEGRTVAQHAAPDPAIGKLARLDRLKNLNERLSFRRNAAMGGGFGRIRHVMPHRFPKRQDALPARGRSKQDLDDRAAGLVLAQLLVEFRRCRRDFLDQFFQESIVLVGQHLGQSVERLFLGIAELGGNLDWLGALVRAVAEGASAHDVDVAGHRIALADRQLACR